MTPGVATPGFFGSRSAVRQANESGDAVIGAAASEKLEGIGEPPRADRALTQRLLLLRGAQLFVMPRGLLRL